MQYGFAKERLLLTLGAVYSSLLLPFLVQSTIDGLLTQRSRSLTQDTRILDSSAHFSQGTST
jgi:hypothetical protein